MQHPTFSLVSVCPFRVPSVGSRHVVSGISAAQVCVCVCTCGCVISSPASRFCINAKSWVFCTLRGSELLYLSNFVDAVVCGDCLWEEREEEIFILSFLFNFYYYLLFPLLVLNTAIRKYDFFEICWILIIKYLRSVTLQLGLVWLTLKS